MAKRGQNEGSIYQRGDGLWVSAITLGWENGKLKRKYIYGKTRAEVSQKLTKELHDRQRGLPTITNNQTVEQFLNQWILEVVTPSVRPLTLVSYKLHVNRYLIPNIGRHKLVKLEPRHVQQLMNKMLADGLSPRTVQYMRSVLRRALNQALKWELVGRNVATLVAPPRSEKPEITPLSEEQARRFLIRVKVDRLEALYTVAMAIGLRKGEALGLRWSDVDLVAGTISVRNTLQRIDRTLQLVPPKTERSRRTITLPAQLTRALKQHHKRQLEERLKAGPKWKSLDFVFCTPIGTPLDQRNVTRQFKAHLEAEGLPEIVRFHDLRHTCATMLLAQGVPMRAIMELLGHSQITLTMDTYSHILPTMKNDMADLMGRMFFSAEEDLEEDESAAQ